MVSRAEIENHPNVRKGWLREAAKRTAQFKSDACYQEKSSIWSEVKPIYMRLQGDCKCAYCERKLESVTYGKGEQDVKHFRPKGNVCPWKLPAALKNTAVVLTPVSSHTGYCRTTCSTTPPRASPATVPLNGLTFPSLAPMFKARTLTIPPFWPRLNFRI